MRIIRYNLISHSTYWRAHQEERRVKQLNKDAYRVQPSKSQSMAIIPPRLYLPSSYYDNLVPSQCICSARKYYCSDSNMAWESVALSDQLSDCFPCCRRLFGGPCCDAFQHYIRGHCRILDVWPHLVRFVALLRCSCIDRFNNESLRDKFRPILSHHKSHQLSNQNDS